LCFGARLLAWGGAIRSRTTRPVGGRDHLPPGKWGVPRAYVLRLPVPTDAPRGIYRVQVLVFRIPTWQALPMTRVGGADVNQLIAGSVLIAPADYLPTPDLPKLGATGQSQSYR